MRRVGLVIKISHKSGKGHTTVLADERTIDRIHFKDTSRISSPSRQRRLP